MITIQMALKMIVMVLVIIPMITVTMLMHNVI